MKLNDGRSLTAEQTSLRELRKPFQGLCFIAYNLFACDAPSLKDPSLFD